MAARSRQPLGHDQPAGVRAPRMREVARLSAARLVVARPRAVAAIPPALRGQMHRACVRDFGVDVVRVKGHRAWPPRSHRRLFPCRNRWQAHTPEARIGLRRSWLGLRCRKIFAHLRKATALVVYSPHILLHGLSKCVRHLVERYPVLFMLARAALLVFIAKAEGFHGLASNCAPTKAAA
ncbi:hypothetical protein RZS08_07025 [Arthrospira platensis SPKY1]|nr:hypothetical protein [Arthrospira platensis SPKY1]